MASSIEQQEQQQQELLFSRFLLLPTLVRDEIFRHLFPPSKAIWLRRNHFSPLLVSCVTEYRNAFWRRRRLEHEALARCYPPDSTGFPRNMWRPEDGARGNSEDNEAVRDLVTMRLVCRQLYHEATAYMTRHGTLWWQVSESEALHSEKLTPDDASALGKAGNMAALTDTMEHDKAQGMLRWIRLFTRINIMLQEQHLGTTFEALNTVLSFEGARSARLPSIHLIVCGFKLLFDQAEMSWQAYLPHADVTQRFLQTRWNGKMIRNAEPAEAVNENERDDKSSRLVVERVEQDGEAIRWSTGDSNFWLDGLQFSNFAMTADAKVDGKPVDLSGRLIYYTYKDYDKPAQEEAVPSSEVAAV